MLRTRLSRKAPSPAPARLLTAILATAAAFAALAPMAGPAAGAVAPKPELTASQATDLVSGTEITVTGKGFTAKTSLFVAICDTKQPLGKACDTGNFARATTDADGDLTATMKPVATFGSTDCTATTCALMTNDPANPRDTRNFAQLPVTFSASPAASSPEPASATPAASSAPPTADSSADSSAAQTAPGDDTGTGLNVPLIAGIVLVVLVVVAVAVVAVRRRRTG